MWSKIHSCRGRILVLKDPSKQEALKSHILHTTGQEQSGCSCSACSFMNSVYGRLSSWCSKASSSQAMFSQQHTYTSWLLIYCTYFPEICYFQGYVSAVIRLQPSLETTQSSFRCLGRAISPDCLSVQDIKHAPLAPAGGLTGSIAKLLWD